MLVGNSWHFLRFQSHLFHPFCPFTLDPTTIHQETEQNTKESDEDLLGYASAMIASLRLERDAERKAHNETRRRTASRISALEAQLACREAELESCVAHTNDHPSMNELRYIDAPENPTMTHDEVIRVLDMTSAKNKTLEMELKILVKRVRLVFTVGFSWPNKLPARKGSVTCTSSQCIPSVGGSRTRSFSDYILIYSFVS